MPAPASYVAGLGRGSVSLTYHWMSRPNGTTALLDSRLVQISGLPERVHLQKLLRASEYLSLEDFIHPLHSEAQARRGEEPEIDPEQFQDPDNEYGLFAGTTYEQDDEEADKIYDDVDQKMDSRRRARRCVLSG